MTDHPSVGLDARRRRILFRATHRGTYENDILIGGFVRARLASFTEAELDALETVMDFPDAVHARRVALVGDGERLRQALGLGLLGIADLQPPLAAITQQ